MHLQECCLVLKIPQKWYSSVDVLNLLLPYKPHRIMKNIFILGLILIASSAFSQERYMDLTRDSVMKRLSANFDNVASNDTALVIKHKRDGTDWRYFMFGKSGKCEVVGWEVAYYNDFIDLENKLKRTKFKNKGEVEYNFVVNKIKGAIYTNGKENYILMYGAINPNMSATTRGIVYFKTK